MINNIYTIEGKIVDVVNRFIFSGKLVIEDGIISKIEKCKTNHKQFILPGLIDSHVHIESSMLIPSEFARLAVCHGTVATVSDPHEIGNVLGVDGVEFMIENGNKVPFKFFFGAPSCVPATPFETSGAIISAKEIDYLLQKNEIKYLTEMMNFPGVLNDDKDVFSKLSLAKKHNKPVDGHAPGLKGKDAEKYVHSGISTDHECSTIEEAIDKINAGMYIQIREGSAAKNFDALKDLLNTHPDKVMLCSDDKHPDDLERGHINSLVKRSLDSGCNLFDVLRSATLIPIQHYNLPVGLLQEGDSADITVIDNLDDFNILQTYISGELVAERGKPMIKSIVEDTPNKFLANKLTLNDIKLKPKSNKIRVIKAFDGELLTEQEIHTPKVVNNHVVSDIENDILKIVVQNRYEENAKPAISFVHGFGIKNGAIASSVAHDSHNIIAVGTTDEDILEAINMIINEKGGISVINGNRKSVLPLPVAGIMSNQNAYEVSKFYSSLNNEVKQMGSQLSSPFMTLSFMALLVIPSIKLSDKGLFDANKFEFICNFN